MRYSVGRGALGRPGPRAEPTVEYIDLVMPVVRERPDGARRGGGDAEIDDDDGPLARHTRAPELARDGFGARHLSADPVDNGAQSGRVDPKRSHDSFPGERNRVADIDDLRRSTASQCVGQPFGSDDDRNSVARDAIRIEARIRRGVDGLDRQALGIRAAILIESSVGRERRVGGAELTRNSLESAPAASKPAAKSARRIAAVARSSNLIETVPASTLTFTQRYVKRSS